MMLFETYRQETDASSEIKTDGTKDGVFLFLVYVACREKDMFLAGSSLSRPGYLPMPWFLLRSTYFYLSLFRCLLLFGIRVKVRHPDVQVSLPLAPNR
jgi:hypothetical protein